jgi:uncharacterized protein (UPF0335 family)
MDDTPTFTSDDVINSAAQGRLRTIIERLERLNEDKAIISHDFKEVMAEARGEGFDPAVIRKVLKIRAADKTKLSEEEALIDLYMSAIEG